MRKNIALIPISAIITIALMMALIVTATGREQPNPGFPRHLADFEQRCYAYRHSNPDIPQTVVLGPSYVHQLGPLEGAYNLGLVQARPKEIERFAANICRPQDTIILGVTIRDIMLANEPVRHEVTSPLARKAYLAKSKFAPEAKRKGVQTATADEISVLAKSLDPSLFSSLDINVMVSHIKKCAQAAPCADSLNPYIRLYNKHPNICFVLFPTIPLLPVDDNSDFGIALNKASANIRLFADLFRTSGLPVAEPPRLPASTYRNLCHYTPEGNAIIRRSLSMYASRT